MGSMSAVHWIILGLVVVLLFGRGKVSELMGDVAKGIKSFKKGMAEDDEPVGAKSTRLEHGVDDRATASAEGVAKAPIRE